uniref:Uncharacterized protein n=1 Tax=Panagrolaimus sp. JU765 TaxID=591449 RepID=A0AC34Q990_9BILA
MSSRNKRNKNKNKCRRNDHVDVDGIMKSVNDAANASIVDIVSAATKAMSDQKADSKQPNSSTSTTKKADSKQPNSSSSTTQILDVSSEFRNFSVEEQVKVIEEIARNCKIENISGAGDIVGDNRQVLLTLSKYGGSAVMESGPMTTTTDLRSVLMNKKKPEPEDKGKEASTSKSKEKQKPTEPKP